MKISYWKPTPKKMRILGDALLTLSISFTGLSYIDEYRAVCIGIAIAAGLGKFLTNWFADEKVAERNQ